MINLNMIEPFGIWSIIEIGIIGRPEHGPTTVILDEDILGTRNLKEGQVWQCPVQIACEEWSSQKDVSDLLHAMVVKMSMMEKPDNLRGQMDPIHLNTVSVMVDIIDSKASKNVT